MANLWGVLKGLLVQNDSDRTKQISIEADDTATTNTRTTLSAKQTANRQLDLPDADDTLVGRATTDTLTNKTIDADANTITNIENADIKAAAAIDATKLSTGVVDNTEFDNLNGVGSQVVGESDTNTLTNKTIDADSNTISNIDDSEIKALAGIDATKIADGSVDNTEFQRLNGLTGDIQSQIDAKVDKIVSVDNTVPRFDGIGGDVQASGVTIDDTDNLTVPGNATVTGDLTVNGTTTTVNTATLEVEDANITVNNNGDQAGANANVAGITVEMSDATDARLGYDSTLASRFKLGEVGSEAEIADVSSTQTLTNKTIDGDNNTISNLAHGAEVDNPTSGVHGVTGDVVGTTDTQALSNKTITASDVDLTGAASATNRIVAPSDTTANLEALARKKGAIYFDDDTDTYKGDDGVNLIDLGGSGSAGRNYILNPNAENGTANVTTTANITLAEETTSPLRQTRSFKFTVTTSATTADYIEFDMEAIDIQDLGKNNFVSFDYRTDANYSSDDLEVRMRNTDDPADETLLAGGTGQGKIGATNGNNNRFQGRIAIDSTDRNYKMRIYVLSAPASNSEIVIDNIKVGPDSLVDSPIVTDWVDYTPTGSWTTNTTYSGKYRRVGDTMELQADISCSGAPTAASLTVDLPLGLNIDFSKLETDTSIGLAAIESRASAIDSSAGRGYACSVTARTASPGQVELFELIQFGTNEVSFSGVNSTNPFTFAANDSVQFRIELPIVEWANSSSVLSTTETLNEISYQDRETAVQRNLPNNVVTPLEFDVLNRTVGGSFSYRNGVGYNATLGTWTTDPGFIINETGYYEVHASQAFVSNASGERILLYEINGTTERVLDRRAGTTGGRQPVQGSATGIYLEKGDIFTLTGFQNSGAALSTDNDSNYNWVTFKKCPDFSVYSVYDESPKSQTKFLTADKEGLADGASGTLTDLQLNNLVPGQWYNLKIRGRFEITTTSTDNISISATHDSNNILGIGVGDHATAGTAVVYDANDIDFQATATTVTFSWASLGNGNKIAGSSSIFETYVVIKTIDPITETSEFS